MFFILGIIVPIVFLIYNIYCFKHKTVIYAIKSKEFIICNDKFFKLQLIMGILNSILLSMTSFMWELNSMQFGAVIYIGIFWMINYSVKGIAIAKGYARN